MAADRELIEAVRRGLAARADPAKAPGMQAYMKSAMPFLGVQKPARDELARRLFATRPLAAFEDWRDTALALWEEAAHREERYLAIALVGDGGHTGHRDLAALPLYRRLIVEGAWWDHVDAVAAGLVEELLERRPAEVGPALREWARDPDMWLRRAAIIAQVRRKAATDFALLTDCIEPNRGDPEFFIRKGIGWALRAYAWVEPDLVEAYCGRVELSPLSRREALRNLDRIRAGTA